MQLRGGQMGTGVWTAVVRTTDFILREAFEWLRAVVSYILNNKIKLKINKYFKIKEHTQKDTTLHGERPAGLEARRSCAALSDVEEDGGGLVQGFSSEVVKRKWSWDMVCRQRQCDLLMMCSWVR